MLILYVIPADMFNTSNIKSISMVNADIQYETQGTINVTSSYNSRNQEIESSLVARGDLWRVEASRGGSTAGNENSPLFLIQLGPVLFVRDSTLLLPVHLSKQHLLWYGYDRKVNTSFFSVVNVLDFAYQQQIVGFRFFACVMNLLNFIGNNSCC